VPYGQHKKIIDAIKGGSCYFINHPDEYYARTSPILNSRFELSSLALNPALASASLPNTDTESIPGTTPSATMQAAPSKPGGPQQN
jgi:hypothetical protein